MKYNFTEARERIEYLRHTYRRLRHTQAADGSWDWILVEEIEQLESEIASAKRKMTSGKGSHHVKNRVSSIITQLKGVAQ